MNAERTPALLWTVQAADPRARIQARPLWSRVAIHLALAFLVLVCGERSAWAQCTTGTTTMSPAFSSMTVSPGQNGQTLWTGTITASATCSGGYATSSYLGYPAYGISAYAPTVFGSSASDTVSLNGVPGITATFGPASSWGGTCTFLGVGNYLGTGNIVEFRTPTPPTTCTASVTWPVTLKMDTSKGAIAGTVPATQMAAGSSLGGWGRVSAWGEISSPIPPLSSGSIVFTSVTCTVSTPTLTVALPTISKTAVASAGATAGLTPFTLSFTGCSSSPSGFSVTQTWSFTTGPASNVIANTGTATNVHAQILDSTLTPITNGGTTSFTVPAAGGASTQQFYARYYSAGSGSAGSVSGTATFTLTYL